MAHSVGYLLSGLVYSYVLAQSGFWSTGYLDWLEYFCQVLVSFIAIIEGLQHLGAHQQGFVDIQTSGEGSRDLHWQAAMDYKPMASPSSTPQLPVWLHSSSTSNHDSPFILDDNLVLQRTVTPTLVAGSKTIRVANTNLDSLNQAKQLMHHTRRLWVTVSVPSNPKRKLDVLKKPWKFGHTCYRLLL